MPISVIVPTYKSPEVLDLCLRSLIEGQVEKNEIIVVVDGFYDLNKEVLDKWKDSVSILNLPENVGLCRATNLGVYNASNENILIINDDNVASKDWDYNLSKYNLKDNNFVISPNQIEPIPSIFPQFVIENLGRDPKTFNLEAFWKFANSIGTYNYDNCGSTLPIYMRKIDYLRVGGWDENYTDGLVADWDFFLKCQLSGLEMLRTYNCHFYHFVSLSTNVTPEQQQKRQKAEQDGHSYAAYKWGKPIQHNPTNNLKYL